MTIRIRSIALLLLVTLAVGGASAGEAAKVMFSVTGHIKGGEIDDDEASEGSMRVEAMLFEGLAGVMPMDNLDTDVLREGMEKAQVEAALAGGSMADIQKLLAPYELDAFLRITYRTAPVLKAGDKHSAAASMVAEIIDMKTGVKAAVVRSKLMGTMESPDASAEGAYNAAVAALETASASLIEALKASDAMQRLNAGKPLTDPAAATGGKKVLFVIAGKVPPSKAGETVLIDKLDSQAAATTLEAILDERLRTSLKLQSFDKQTLAKIQGDAQAWAALQGDSLADIAQTLNQYGVDVLLRVGYHAGPVTAKDGAYASNANVTAFVVDAKTGKKTVVFSPRMGSEAHPSKTATDPYAAALLALEYAADQTVGKLQKKIGALGE